MATAVFIYFAKSILCLGFLWLYYYLFLRGNKFHTYNRYYLIISVFIGFILPCVKVSWFTISPNNQALLKILQYWNPAATQAASSSEPTAFYPILGLILLFIVSLFLLIYWGMSIYNLMKLKAKFPIQKLENYTLVHTNLEEAPFSFLKNLFWREDIDINTPEGKHIFLHEMAHIGQNHSYDRMFMQIVKSIFWFNPFLHLIHREIILIHEYLADQQAIQGQDTESFAKMLLTAQYPQALSIASPFFSKTIKKRIQMINKKHHTQFSYARRIWALPVVILLTFTFLVQAKNKEIQEENLQLESIANQIPDAVEPIAENDSLKKIMQQKAQQLAKRKEQLQKEQAEIEALQKQLKKKEKELTRLSKKDNAKAQEEAKIVEKQSQLLIKEAQKLAKEEKKIEKFVFDLRSSGKDDKTIFQTFKLDTLGNKVTAIMNFKELDWDIDFQAIDLDSVLRNMNVENLKSLNIDLDQIDIDSLKEKILDNKMMKNKNMEIHLDGDMQNQVIKIESVNISPNTKTTSVQKIATSGDQPIVFLDGKEVSFEKMQEILPEDIESIKVLKGNVAKQIHNTDKGVIEITTKKK